MNEIPRKKVELMRASDWVTCTTEVFEKSIRTKLGIKNVMVFPNAVDPNEPQFQSKPTESDKIRFGWLGGSTHYHDLELLSSGISTNFKSNSKYSICVVWF